MNKTYCRNSKGFCPQLFAHLIGFDGYVPVCGVFEDPKVKGRLHLLNETKRGTLRLEECRKKYGVNNK